jgi:hypothetical protein
MTTITLAPQGCGFIFGFEPGVQQAFLSHLLTKGLVA